MTPLAFVLSVALIPGIMGAATAGRWALLSVVVPLLLWRARPEMTVGHLLGLLFLVWCAATLAWSQTLDGLNFLWRFMLLAGIFCLAAQCDMRRVFIALGLGAAINSGVMLAQTFGWDYLPQNAVPGGLFLNANLAAEFCALVLVGLVGYRVWWMVPFPALAIALTSCRGAVMGLAAAFGVWLWGKSHPLAVALFVCMAALGSLLLLNGSHGGSGLQRLMVWEETISLLTWHGSGLGSFAMTYPQFGFFFEHAHNDLLQVAAETGVGVLFLVAILVVAMTGPHMTERCVLACFVMEGLVGWPLYVPATGFIAALVAGRLCADGTLVRDGIARCRSALFARAYWPGGTAGMAYLPFR